MPEARRSSLQCQRGWACSFFPPGDPASRVPHAKALLVFPAPVEGSRLAGRRWPGSNILVEVLWCHFHFRGSSRHKARPSL